MSDQPTPAGPAECDIVMKGGITSGVVYPLAVVELARTYRFRNIGGTSAGAIAAGMTAAAEYARDAGGFERLEQLAGQLGGSIQDLFQPTPPLRTLFAMLMANLEGGSRSTRLLRSVLVAATRHWGIAALSLGLIAGLSAWAAARGAAWSTYVLIFLVAAALWAGLTTRVLWRAVFEHLPQQGFGMCLGLAQRGGRGPGLTEWLAERMEWIAGLKGSERGTGRPLTFGDLQQRSIHLQIMTTNLSAGCPLRMPGPKHAFEQNLFMYREADFAQLFPEHVLRWMRERSQPVSDAPNYRWLPQAADLPVVVAVRMSLSFPLLIAAVPLYARDFTFLDEAQRQAPRRCWFSDGGICSNFPIHFFDHTWPTRPTFGILLEPCQPEHQDRRVFLPTEPKTGWLQSLRSVDSLGQFLTSILDTMQEWRDRLQTILPGYRERVVRIRLSADEGGMNLNMPAARIEGLAARGREAGQTLVTDFNWDEHRWRRHLVWMAQLEEALARMRATYVGHGSGDESFQDFLARYARAAKSYKNEQGDWQNAMEADVRALIRLAEDWGARETLRSGSIPRPEVQLRLTPKL